MGLKRNAGNPGRGGKPTASARHGAPSITPNARVAAQREEEEERERMAAALLEIGQRKTPQSGTLSEERSSGVTSPVNSDDEHTGDQEEASGGEVDDNDAHEPEPQLLNDEEENGEDKPNGKRGMPKHWASLMEFVKPKKAKSQPCERDLSAESKWIYRLVNLNLDIQETVLDCIAFENANNGKSRLLNQRFKDKSDEERENAALVAEKFLKVCTTFDNDLIYYCKDISTAKDVARFMTEQANTARNNDNNNVKGAVLYKIPVIDGFPIISDRAPMEDRGFNSVQTAALIIPLDKRERFYEDPEAFIAEYEAGRVSWEAQDLPSFLWDHEKITSTSYYDGFLEGPVLIRAYRAAFTGPDSAKNADDGPVGRGRPCVSRDFGFKSVTFESIAYIAALTRFALSSKPVWCERDGNVVFHELYDAVLEMVKDADETWKRQVLAKWNKRVFGVKPSTVWDNFSSGEKSVLQLMREENARRRAGSAAAAGV